MNYSGNTLPRCIFKSHFPQDHFLYIPNQTSLHVGKYTVIEKYITEHLSKMMIKWHKITLWVFLLLLLL